MPRDRTRRPRRFLLVPAVLLLLFLGGFAAFALGLPPVAPPPDQRTDAIVVLTGGSERLKVGFELLEQGAAQKLFVSGVYRGVEVSELLRLGRGAPEELACCIALGYDAEDTHGNAREAAEWMRREGLTSLRLVTGAYHLPRSMMEFRRALPEAEIVPHPVFPVGFREQWWFSPDSAWLLMTEYVKFLAALAAGLLPGGLDGLRA
ncbi:MAG: YdcF family protein [Tistlia sp.]|uniref:YdcF family protein n=1 Tax=Tistlia sp. TaxID=3057121 RepID=UPI0034A14D59